MRNQERAKTVRAGLCPFQPLKCWQSKKLQSMASHMQPTINVSTIKLITARARKVKLWSSTRVWKHTALVDFPACALKQCSKLERSTEPAFLETSKIQYWGPSHGTTYFSNIFVTMGWKLWLFVTKSLLAKFPTNIFVWLSGVCVPFWPTLQSPKHSGVCPKNPQFQDADVSWALLPKTITHKKIISNNYLCVMQVWCSVCVALHACGILLKMSLATESNSQQVVIAHQKAEKQEVHKVS